MTRVALFVLDKRKESPEQFETRVNWWLQKTGHAELIGAAEDAHNSTIAFTFLIHGEKKHANQELCVIAWSELETLEGVVNNALANLEESGRQGKDIHFVTTSKSARALAAFIVEGNRPYLSSSGPEQSDANAVEHQAEEAKQDQTPDAKPKRTRKAKSVT